MSSIQKIGIGIVVVFIVGGIFFMAFKFYKAFKDIKESNRTFGYKIQLDSIPHYPFKKNDWEAIFIDYDQNYTDGAHNMVPYDLDKDGVPELIANAYRTDNVVIYKQEQMNLMDWTRYVVDQDVGDGIPTEPFFAYAEALLKEKLLNGYLGGAHYTAIADMNNDDIDDLIEAGDRKRNDIVWYESPNDITQVRKWKKHIVYRNDSHRTYHVETGDIDMDGKRDVVYASKTDNSIGWIKNVGGGKEWPSTWIDKNCTRSFNVRVQDINKDGKNDVLASEDDKVQGGKFHFYEYTGDPEKEASWKNHIIAQFSPGHGVSIFEIVDIDSDNDFDIVTANHQGNVCILQNPWPEEVRGEWPTYYVSGRELNEEHIYREVDIGDIDGDQDFDIVVADEKRNLVLWYENNGHIFYDNWQMHIIDQSDHYLKWCHSAELGDLNGDGALDLAVAAAASNIYLVYINHIQSNY